MTDQIKHLRLKTPQLVMTSYNGFVLGPTLANFDSGGNPWKHCSVYIHDEQKQEI